MLEIGALSPNNFAAKQPYINNTPIDLNSQHPDILAQDFLQRPLPQDDNERFDIVSCSLVLNFVPEPRDRGEWDYASHVAQFTDFVVLGEMLKLIHDQLHPSERSLLFLVLPTACTENSRYMSSAHLETILSVVGFAQVRRRARPGGKVIYTLWKWQRPNANPQAVKSSSKRAELRSGAKRNNFVVLLK
jgi:25S rRNA (adenine2142-N1)-methyltransferase